MGANLGRVINDYEGLAEICRQRAAELEITRGGIDDLSDLPNGFARKVLGSRQRKKMGPLTLGPMLPVLGLKMLIIEDEASTVRTLAPDARRSRQPALWKRFAAHTKMADNAASARDTASGGIACPSQGYPGQTQGRQIRLKT
jgi:hypothetical protein